MQKQKGLTLLELLITLAISAIILGWSLPHYGKLVSGQRLKANTSAALSFLNSARFQALTKRRYVTVCPWSNNQCSTDWQQPWVAFFDDNRDEMIDSEDDEIVFAGWQPATLSVEINWTNRRYLQYKPTGTANGLGLSIYFCEQGEANRLLMHASGRWRVEQQSSCH